MKILVLCAYGKNRSRHLAEYLTGKGYEADFDGVYNDVSAVQKKIDRSDVIITVHDAVREGAQGRFDFKGKRHIELDVEDRSGILLDGQAWIDFQHANVYSRLEGQIDPYLPL